MKYTYKQSFKDKQKSKDTSYLIRRHLSQEPIYKKVLKGKLLCLIKGSLILNEDKFNPLVSIFLFTSLFFTFIEFH